MLKRLLRRLRGSPDTKEKTKNSGFVPVKDKDGNVTGVMDSIMAAYLESKAPDPSQQALDAMLADVTRVKIFDGGMIDDNVLNEKILLEVKDLGFTKALCGCLKIIEDPDTFGHCMCLGDLSMEFYSKKKRLATIGFHHGQSIRWSAWKHDALLQNSQCYLTLLAEHGVTAPLNAFNEDRLREEETKQAWNRWVHAIPSCLKKLSKKTWQKIIEEDTLQPVTDILASAYPDISERLLKLFRWFGSGKGPWTGFPVYEQFAEQILLQYSEKDLLTALTSAPLTENELEGAARLFAGRSFQGHSETQVVDQDAIGFSEMLIFIPKRSGEPTRIPDALKRQLLQHILTSSDDDKIDRAKKAFRI